MSDSDSLFRQRWIKVALSLLLALGFVWLLKRGALPLVPPRSAFAGVMPRYVFGFIVAWSGVHLLRAGRWYWLLAAVHRVPLTLVLRAACVGFMAIVATPFRMGEMVRPLMIRREGKLSAWAATGTVGAERVIDGVCISLILLVSLLLAKPVEPLPDRIGDLPIPARLIPGAAYTAVAGFMVLFLLMGVFYFWRQWARRVTETLLGIVSPKLASYVADRVELIAEGLGFLRDIRYSGPFILGTLGYWFLNAFAWWILALGCGLSELTFVQACVVMGVLALGILIPNAPGFFGAFQLAVYAGLALYLPITTVTGPGSAFVFLIYALQMGITVGAGVIFLLVKPVEVLAED